MAMNGRKKNPSRQDKEDIVNVWRARLIRSHRAKEPFVKQWRIINEMYHFNYYTDVSNLDRVVVGKLFSNVRQMVSALYFQNPTMFSRALTPMGEWTGPIMEQVLNRTRKVIDAEEEERLALTNALLYSTGIIKHGYHAEFYGPETPIADPKMPKDRGEGGATWESETVGLPMVTEHDEGIRFEQPWKKSIHPMNFFADPECKRDKEARWMAHQIQRPYIDVVRDSRYDAAARKELEPTGPSAWFATEGDEDFLERFKEGNTDATDSAMVVLYEIYDRTTNEITTIAENCKIPLSIVEYPYRSGPYTIFQFFPSDKSFWGISYAWTFMTQVQALNKLRSRMLQHFDAWGRTKAAVSRQDVDEEEAKAWCDQPDNSLLFLNNPDGKDVNKIFNVFQHVPVPSDAYTLTNMFEKDLDEISGVSELSRGSSQGVQTATEASIMQQGQGLRVADMRYILERAIVNSDRKIMDILIDFWRSDKVIPIVGPDGINWDYVQVAREVLPGGFEIDIEPGSTERVDKSVRIRQAIDMMAQLTPMVPYLQAQGYDINWPELVKILLKNTEIVRMPDRILRPLQPPPQPGGIGTPPSSGQGAITGPNDPAYLQSQVPGAMNVGAMGGAPWESPGGVSGRMMSEAMAGV